MERVLLKSARPACRCHLCTAFVGSGSIEAIALTQAQAINGHGPMCGTDWVPCVMCDEVQRTLIRRGEQAIREMAGCELASEGEEAEAQAAEQAALYFRAIEPGRLPLWSAPVWIADVAEIGDMIRARAEKEIYDQAKKGKHAG